MATRLRATFPAAGSAEAVRHNGASPLRWRRPTVDEFIEQIEHEFGATADLSALLAMGLGPRDTLAPGDIRLICAEIGVPPEDFGV